MISDYRTQAANAARDALVAKHALAWRAKYGASWYNDRAVLNAQKRVMRKAWYAAQTFLCQQPMLC